MCRIKNLNIETDHFYDTNLKPKCDKLKNEENVMSNMRKRSIPFPKTH